MPLPVHHRGTLPLLAVALRRGEESVAALAALARGREIEPAEFEQLKRAGLLQGQRLPPRLIAPVLALEASLGLAGAELLEQLLALLKGANDRPAREALLIALADQLEEQIGELSNGSTQAARLNEVLDDLALTISRMQSDDAEPTLVTQVAQLVAQLVARLAEAVALPRRSRRPVTLPDWPPELLARAAADLVASLPRPLTLPGAEALVRAFIGDEQPPQAPPARALELSVNDRAARGKAVEAALRSADPARSLYAGQDLDEALRRHARLIGYGRDLLSSAEVVPTADRVQGPEPLSWSTALAPETAKAEAEQSEAA